MITQMLWTGGATVLSISALGGLCDRDAAGPTFDGSLNLSGLALEDGDLLLAFMWAASDGTAAAQTPSYCDEVTDWKPIKNGSKDLSPPTRVFVGGDSTFTSANHSDVAVMWRRWSTGDPTTYTFVNPNAGISVCVYGIRGVHEEDPFPYVVFYPGTNAGGAIPGHHSMPPNPMPYVAGCARLDVVQLSNTSYDATTSDLTVPDTGDVLFYGYELPYEDGAGNISIASGMFYTLRYPVAGEANNLLSYSNLNADPAGSGWTLTNITYAASALAGLTYNRFAIAASGSSLAREMTRPFTCAAGKFYCLWTVRDSQFAAWTQGYLRSGTFHGFRYVPSASRNIKEGSDDTFPAAFPVALEDGAGTTGAMTLLLTWFGGFEAETTVDLVVGFCDISSPYERQWVNGSARAANIQAVGLAEVPSLSHVPALIENNTASPLTGVNMTHAMMTQIFPANFTTTNVGFSASAPSFAFSLMVRGLASSAPTQDLREQQWLPHDFNHLSATEFEEFKTGYMQWSMARRIDACSAYAHCPRPAIPSMGHDKLYCEYTIEAIGSSNVNPEDPWVYVCPVGDGAEHAGADKGILPRSALTATLRYGFYAWGRKGRFNENGVVTLVAGSTIFTGTDILGVGVNYADQEITWYLNGVLVRTTAMDAHRAKYWLGTGIAFGEGSRTNHFPQVSVNWAGPFGGRLPAGFEAWDWPNA